MNFRTAILSLALFGWLVVSARGADVFDLGGVRNTSTGTWTGLASVEFVPVGDVGNAADPDTGYGRVDYAFNMGKYDVTAGQYCEFLNAVAKKSDPYSLYNVSMNVAATGLGCNIVRSSSSGNYLYTVAADWANRPVNYVSWGDAARFCNWLQNGQKSGVEDATTTETGVYTLNGANTDAALLLIKRNDNAKYFIPTLNEWYKAAYFDPNKTGPGQAGYWLLPMKSDSLPSNILSVTGSNNANFVGESGTGTHGYTIGNPYFRTDVGAFTSSPSPYGTFDQGGNVYQWTDTVTVSGVQEMNRRGGCFTGSADNLSKWDTSGMYPGQGDFVGGFRVASISAPEPSSILMLFLGGMAGLLGWSRNRGIQGRNSGGIQGTSYLIQKMVTPE